MATAASSLGERRRYGLRKGLISLSLFAVVAAALLGTVMLLFSTIETERVQRTQVARTNEILLAMQAIERAAVNGENGQRGFFITQDRRYLEPYLYGHKQYPQALGRLRGLLGEDATPRQRELLAEIERLSDAKWAEMADTVAQVEQGELVGAHVRILSDEGQLAMIRLRGVIGELEVIERGILEQAERRTQEAEDRIGPALLALFTILLAAIGLGLWQVARTVRIEAAAANAEAIAEARDRADLLAKELNHRVKNLFAVILAIVRMTGKDEPAARPVVDRIAERIHALVRAHEVSQGAYDRSRVSLRDLISTAVAPYLSASEQCDADGPDIALSEKHAVPIGLVLHELVTNAVKYGAWSAPEGLVRIRWRSDGGRVVLDWEEQAAREVAIAPEGRAGFGSALIQSAARQMSGSIERTTGPRGIAVRMEFVPGE
jgi:two-component sensor histidine kinase